MGWFKLISNIIFVIIFILLPVFSLILGTILLIRYKKTRNEKNLIFGVVLIVLVVIILILWVLFSGIFKEKTDFKTDDVPYLSPVCLSSNVSATNVTRFIHGNPGQNDIYLVTLSRESGSDEIDGVIVAFMNDLETNNFVEPISGDIPLLQNAIKTVEVPVSALENSTKVRVAIYFMNEAGEQQICPTSKIFKFA
jgi:hypothetical protein